MGTWGQAEKWLQTEDVERLRTVLGGREDALLLLTRADGTLLWGSALGSVSMFGRTPEEYLGRLGQDYLHPDDRAAVAQALAEAGLSGATQEMDFRAIGADGATVRVRTVAWRVQGTADDPVVVSITVAQGARPRGAG